jgi:hypothetical protein
MMASALDRDSFATIRNALCYDWNDVFHRWQLYRLVSATFVQDHGGLRWSILGLVPLLMVAEMVMGSHRLAVVFFVGDIVSSLLVLVALRIGASFGSGTAADLLAIRDGGTSSALFASLMAASWLLSRPQLRWGAVGLLGLTLLAAAVVFHRLFDAQHLVAAIVGLWCGELFAVRRLARRTATEGRHSTMLGPS